MSKIQHKEVSGILNETSMTIHKHQTGTTDYQTLCGQTYHIGAEQLKKVDVGRAAASFNATKCDQCFGHGRGY